MAAPRQCRPERHPQRTPASGHPVAPFLQISRPSNNSGAVARTSRLGGRGLYHQFVPECPQRIVDAADGRSVTRVEHTSHYLLIDAEPASECQAGQSTVPKREGKRGLRSRSGWDSDVVLSGTAGARQRYGFVVVNAAGDRFVQRVGRLGECPLRRRHWSDIRADPETRPPRRVRPLRRRHNDNLVSTRAAQLGRINETHEFLSYFPGSVFLGFPGLSRSPRARPSWRIMAERSPAGISFRRSLTVVLRDP